MILTWTLVNGLDYANPFPCSWHPARKHSSGSSLKCQFCLKFSTRGSNSSFSSPSPVTRHYGTALRSVVSPISHPFGRNQSRSFCFSSWEISTSGWLSRNPTWYYLHIALILLYAALVRLARISMMRCLQSTSVWCYNFGGGKRSKGHVRCLIHSAAAYCETLCACQVNYNFPTWSGVVSQCVTTFSPISIFSSTTQSCWLFEIEICQSCSTNVSSLIQPA